MRTFFLGALVLSISAWIGGRQYYLKLNEKEQEKIIEVQEAETEQFEESVESANIQNKKAFVIREEDGYLNVYFGEEDALYMYTGIAYQGLPEELKKEIIETHSAQETFALGQRIGLEALPGQVYTLIGDLGVGKTVFTQGVADGLGITEPVNSPTFTIVQIYEEGRMPFYHFDVYRIGDVEEMEEIGYEDCFYGEGLCLIEWANLIEEILPEHYRQVTIEKDLEKGFDYRRITIEEMTTV